jgi:nicotinamidase-related amidase
MITKRNWNQFALILIDVQKDFWTEQLAMSFPDFPAKVDHLLTLCRTEGIDIVHLRGGYKPDMSDWMVRYRLRGKIACVEGTEGIETLPFAIEKPGEAVIVKQTFDGFLNPNLLPYLRSRGKRFLLTAGLVTSYCVFLTTASAAQLGFLAAVVEDCCADEPFSHEHILERYQQTVFDRTTTDAICRDHTKWMAVLEKLDEHVLPFS